MVHSLVTIFWRRVWPPWQIFIEEFWPLPSSIGIACHQNPRKTNKAAVRDTLACTIFSPCIFPQRQVSQYAEIFCAHACRICQKGDEKGPQTVRCPGAMSVPQWGKNSLFCPKATSCHPRTQASWILSPILLAPLGDTFSKPFPTPEGSDFLQNQQPQMLCASVASFSSSN